MRVRAACAIAALCLGSSVAVGHPTGDVPAAELPERWQTGAAIDGDRSGDLRPQAIAILDAIAATPGDVFTLGAARSRGLVPMPPALGPASFTAPDTIRVWRRGLDGSSSSCSGQVDVIPFAQYVKGVLPHEWIRSWHASSLQAGAVVIRTYAAWWVNAGGKYSCADLDDTTASQVYKDEFFAVTDAAVDATADQYVVEPGGDLVFAEYSAENGDPTDFGVDEPLCSGETVFGHGRGTCQWGSQRWALGGHAHDWIATHYYPGSTIVGVAPIHGATLGASEYRTSIESGDEMVVWLEYTNDGNREWTSDGTMIGTTGPRDRESAFFKPENWIDATRPTGVDHATAPGGVGRFTWAMVAPAVTEPTTFTESFGLVTADGTWFGPADDVVTWTITVYPPGTGPIDPGDPNDPDPVDPSDPPPSSGGCAASAGGGGIAVCSLLVAVCLRRRRRSASTFALLIVLAFAAAACSYDSPTGGAPRVAIGGDSPLVDEFRRAGVDTGVPAELLAAISYVETRFRFAGAYAPEPGHRDDHGAPAIGLLALHEAGVRDIARGAALASVDEAAAHTDAAANLRAGAALLRDLAPHARGAADFRAAVAAFGGGEVAFADDVYAHLARGFTGTDGAGATLTVSARPELAPPDDGFGTVTQALGYPGAIWNPASTANYQSASRGAANINYIVIHTVQGSYSGCISWFKNPSAEVSAHYVVRSSDGEVTQMVDDSDIAWHDACFNSETIGIEHEGYVQDPATWYTASMYQESAKLTAWIADQYGIPKDRDHIFGHGEAPDCSDHYDPGTGWDWEHYMDLVRTGGLPQYNADGGALDHPTEMVSGEEVVAWVEYTNRGNTTWDIDQTRLGTQEPQDRESSFFVDGNWLSPSRATGADHSNYGPGSVGRFTFLLRAPEVSETTTFVEAFQLVEEGVAWFGPVVHMTITVHPRTGEGGDEDGDPPIDNSPLDDGDAGGCATSRGVDGAFAFACAMLLARVRRRRTRA